MSCLGLDPAELGTGVQTGRLTDPGRIAVNATEDRTATVLTLSWSTSKGRDTYGYNICRLDDTSTGKRFRCMGGGYDMVGTVFAQWLVSAHADALLGIADRAASEWVDGTYTRRDGELYGLGIVQTGSNRTVSLDGACGLESIRRVAEAIGLTVRSTVVRGRTVGFLVTS